MARYVYDFDLMAFSFFEPREENVELKVSSENSKNEETVSNYGLLKADNIDEIKTNSITHIIQNPYANGESTENKKSAVNDNEEDNIVQTYKIEGLVWEDINKDGMRTGDEEVLSGITVKLINSQGVIQSTVKTDSSGEYSFIGVRNGRYSVVFEYDSVKYAPTIYKKEGISPDVNSDAISAQIEQNGKVIKGAITDIITVSNESVSGIDLGLALAEIFDLQIDKTITKITTQTTKDTKTEEYKNVKMAKTEIASKQVSGAIVYVEYEIKVTNVGDIKGYAKKIVDYIPEGMKFNSSLKENEKWYTGPDGNLYSTALEKE